MLSPVKWGIENVLPEKYPVVGTGCKKAVSMVICCKMGPIFPSLNTRPGEDALTFLGVGRTAKWDLESFLPH